MFRRVLVLAMVFGFCICSARGEQKSCSWIGGTEGEWGNPNNWDCGMVPDNNETNTFNVTIDSDSVGTNRIELQLLQNRTINRLDTYGEVQLDVPNWEDDPSCSTIMFTVLETRNGITNYGMFEVDQERHREIEINGDVTNTDGAEIWLSETNINGNFYNESGGVVDIEYNCEINGNFENAGTMNIWGPVVEFWVEGTLHNDGLINLFDSDCGANIIINDINGVIQGFGGFGVEDEGNLLQNKGAIYASGGSLVIFTEDPNWLNIGFLASKSASSLHIQPGFLGTGKKEVNNHGTIQVHAGDGVAFECSLISAKCNIILINESDGVIELLGGDIAATTITQTADANFAGFGTITGDVVIEPNGLIQLTGPTNIVGDMQIGTGATLEISDGTTLITGYTTNNGTIHMKGGRIIPQGGFTNNGNIIWEPGPYYNIADFNLDGNVNFKDFADFADTWLWQAQL